MGFMEGKVTPQDLTLNLKAAGFEANMIEKYIELWRKGNIKEQLKLLYAKRASVLEHIHHEERKIYCIDYLSYKIRKDKSETQLDTDMIY